MESNNIGNLPRTFSVITSLETVVPAGMRLHNFIPPVVRSVLRNICLFCFMAYLVSETVKLRFDFFKSFYHEREGRRLYVKQI